MIFSIYAPISSSSAGRVITGNSTARGRSGTYNNNLTVPVTTTIPVTVPVSGVGGAFQNGVLVKFATTAPANCTGKISALYNNYPEAVNASSVTNCEIGIGINTTHIVSQYMLVPTFAGLSIYGQVGWNSTVQGYPTFDQSVS